MAESHVPAELKDHKWIEGFNQIKNQLSDFLSKEGVEAIESIGRTFDPNKMESVGEIESPEHKLSNIVLEEVQKGYIMQGKLIRPAKVKVTK